ncbi:serine/threonine-protein phosphatase 6 regulatory ankyrin repeat subunit A-like [Pollicipes pollicipes]|uniref:serine/threonine-protein phosphatase 6 regulatory ankyrin repeat subunit A-like n=1 Tax=Pollicipes pollicipes TaxID=41117 RepID=UPI0018851B22|nr:serine/threonine-protein phosphatase 6 regulatory ankyrin repeat subunit A-like [Pollicipes pollicipes]
MLGVTHDDVTRTDSAGRTALHYAAAADSDGRTIQLLLQQGSEPTRLDDAGYSALHLAAASGHRAGLDLLLDTRGARAVVGAVGDRCLRPAPLHLAAFHGHLANLINLMAMMDNVSLRDDQGRTALHLAAGRGNLSCVLCLLEQKADIDTCDDRGRSPLHAAVAAGHKDCARALLRQLLARLQLPPLESSELRQLLAESKTVKMCPELDEVVNKKDGTGRTPLMLAVENGSAELVLLLLVHGARPGLADAEGRTALFRAAASGAEESVDALLSCTDCDPLARDVLGKTAVHLAAAAGHVLVLGSLLQAVGRGRVDDLLDEQGCTPLHWACYNGHEACAELLLQYSESRTLRGCPFSPLHAAVYQGSEPCLVLLVAHSRAVAVRLAQRAARSDALNVTDSQLQTYVCRPIHGTLLPVAVSRAAPAVFNSAGVRMYADGP